MLHHPLLRPSVTRCAGIQAPQKREKKCFICIGGCNSGTTSANVFVNDSLYLKYLSSLFFNQLWLFVLFKKIKVIKNHIRRQIFRDGGSRKQNEYDEVENESRDIVLIR
jgi:hypothetical protein